MLLQVCFAHDDDIADGYLVVAVVVDRVEYDDLLQFVSSGLDVPYFCKLLFADDHESSVGVLYAEE